MPNRTKRYFNCPCGRILRINGVKVHRHESLRTGTLCQYTGAIIPEVQQKFRTKE